MLVALMAILVACDQGAAGPQATRAVNLKVRLGYAGVHAAASEVPRVEVHLFGCESSPCAPQAADASILEIDESGRLTGEECPVEGAGCEVVFTPQQPTRTLWLPDGDYAVTAAAYLADGDTPAYCSEPSSFAVGATGDNEVLIVMSDDCSDNALSSDATLKSLIVREGDDDLLLTPDFAADVTQYEAVASADADSVTLVLAPNHDAAAVTVEVDDEEVNATDGEYSIPLVEGDTVITIIVTAEDGESTLTTLLTIKPAEAAPANWSETLGTTCEDQVLDVAVDSMGNVYAVGYTFGDLAAEYAGDTYVCGDRDGFLAKFDKDGNRLWVYQYGTSADDSARLVLVAADDSVIVVGDTEGALGGDALGVGADMYVAAFPVGFDPAEWTGDVLPWSWQFGSESPDGLGAVAIDMTGYVHIAYTAGTKQGGPTYATALPWYTGVNSTSDTEILECPGYTSVQAIVPKGQPQMPGGPQGAVIAGTTTSFDGSTYVTRPFVAEFESSGLVQGEPKCFAEVGSFALSGIHLNEVDQSTTLTGYTDSAPSGGYLGDTVPFRWTLDDGFPTKGTMTPLAGGIFVPPAPVALGSGGHVAYFGLYGLEYRLNIVHDTDGFRVSDPVFNYLDGYSVVAAKIVGPDTVAYAGVTALIGRSEEGFVGVYHFSD